MRTRMFFFVLLADCLLLALSGCGSQPLPPALANEGFDDIAGQYRLVSVNGLSVPADLAHGGNIRVLHGEFIIRSDGIIQSVTTLRPPSGGKITRKVNASAVRQGNRLFMQWQGAGSTTGNIANQSFTMDNHGMVMVYVRADPVVVNSEEPAAGTETAQSAEGQPGSRAPAVVVDDFDSGLVNGWDEHRNLLGFITFSDSPNSQVRISTTRDHPALPGEPDDNEVLQVDLDVKAWAGVGHYFENESVDTWQARDWRGHESLSFMLYGQNAQTTLYIDVMDNRNSSSVTGAAELFTYRFSDNLAGWHQISVPFAKLTRKEIGNDAPNDGLGLSRVHGWAFGALKTDGPVTYYLDDFKLE